MKILARNIDAALLGVFRELGCHVKSGIEDLDGCKGVFLVWEGRDNPHHPVMTSIVKDAIKKKIPVIVFDDGKLTDDEVGFFIQNGVFLWEPAVCGRNFFSFQPYWGHIPNHYLETTRHTDERPVALGYQGSLVRKVPSFEKYYKPINDLGKHRVAFFDQDGNKTVNSEIEKMGIPVSETNELKFSKAVVLVDTNENYKTGVLDKRLFQYLHDGIVPLLPVEHRWYHSVFGSLVVRSDKDVSYILNSYDNTRFGLVADIYQGLREHLPEADINTVAKRVLAYLK